MTDLFPPTLDDLIACAEREVVYRTRVYPRRVAARQMSRDLAERELGRMRAIALRLRNDKAAGRE